MSVSPVIASAAMRVEGTTTGFPAGADVALEDVGAQGWTLFDDLTPPVMVLREPAIAHNLDLMRGYVEAHGVAIAPHGKTTMAPAIWRRQLDAGAWGITAATPAQVRVMRDAGVLRILLANELVDGPAIAWVARELADPSFRFACWVDSVEGVDLLASAIRAAGATRPLAVLVELGHPGGRTGARSLTAAMELVEAVADRSELALAGIAGYEGTLADDRSDASLAAVDGFLADLSSLAERAVALGEIDGAGLDDAFVVTAGGSAFFDRVTDVLRRGVGARDDVRVVLRSGCYVTHDHGHYERVSPMPASIGAGGFLPAIEVWGSVLSAPEPGVVVIGAGKRDAAADIEPPIARWIRSRDGSIRDASAIRVTRLMDQHAICAVDGAPPAIGELVGFGISHPCAAFDRRRVIPVVDADGGVIEAIETRF
jgi:D-serine deaminase-like pyridoxal phosphate-dependent protein